MHNHVEMDWQAQGEYLEQEAEVRVAWLEQAVRWVAGDLGAVRRVLDVGSGPGVGACLLAETFRHAEVCAVDGEPALLARAGDRADRLGLADRVTVLQADLSGDLAPLGDADLVWAGQVVHHLGDQQDALRRLARLVRPGGLLVLVEGGLPTRFLPAEFGLGRPGLQSRLDVVRDEWFATMRKELPHAVAAGDGWPAMLDRSGLEFAGSRSFLVDLPAPLDQKARDHLHQSLSRFRDLVTERLGAEDAATFDRLLDPDDDAGVLRRPDVFLLAARTVHLARAPVPRPGAANSGS